MPPRLTVRTPSLKSAVPFVAGDRLTIADIAVFIWAHSANWCGLAIDEFPHVKAWLDKLAQRPAFQKALQVPVPYGFSDAAVNDPDNQEFCKKVRKYGGQSIKRDSDRFKGEAVALPSDHANLDTPDLHQEGGSNDNSMPV